MRPSKKEAEGYDIRDKMRPVYCPKCGWKLLDAVKGTKTQTKIPYKGRYEGADYADGSTPETELFRQLENQRIKEAFGQLSEVQRRRLMMLAEGVSLREIARREGKDIKTIRESIEGARKKFLKFF